jgi:hypothetical protein
MIKAFLRAIGEKLFSCTSMKKKTPTQIVSLDNELGPYVFVIKAENVLESAKNAKSGMI